MSTPKPYDVARYGTDTSARAILLNARMKLALDLVLARLDFTPTIVQGAYMARLGGGADASAGYHDAGGCIDFRVWDLTDAQVRELNHAWRTYAGPGWLRNQAHGGMDPHYHAVVDGDQDAAWGARDQMSQYRQGLDGLSSRGRDYMWRPDPIPAPLDYYEWLRENTLLDSDKDWLQQRFDNLNGNVDRLEQEFQAFRENEVTRDQADVDRDKAVSDALDGLTKKVVNIRDRVKAIEEKLA